MCPYGLRKYHYNLVVMRPGIWSHLFSISYCVFAHVWKVAATTPHETQLPIPAPYKPWFGSRARVNGFKKLTAPVTTCIANPLADQKAITSGFWTLNFFADFECAGPRSLMFADNRPSDCWELEETYAGMTFNPAGSSVDTDAYALCFFSAADCTSAWRYEYSEYCWRPGPQVRSWKVVGAKSRVC